MKKKNKKGIVPMSSIKEQNSIQNITIDESNPVNQSMRELATKFSQEYFSEGKIINEEIKENLDKTQINNNSELINSDVFRKYYRKDIPAPNLKYKGKPKSKPFMDTYDIHTIQKKFPESAKSSKNLSEVSSSKGIDEGQKPEGTTLLENIKNVEIIENLGLPETAEIIKNVQIIEELNLQETDIKIESNTINESGNVEPNISVLSKSNENPSENQKNSNFIEDEQKIKIEDADQTDNSKNPNPEESNNINSMNNDVEVPGSNSQKNADNSNVVKDEVEKIIDVEDAEKEMNSSFKNDYFTNCAVIEFPNEELDGNENPQKLVSEETPFSSQKMSELGFSPILINRNRDRNDLKVGDFEELEFKKDTSIVQLRQEIKNANIENTNEVENDKIKNEENLNPRNDILSKDVENKNEIPNKSGEIEETQQEKLLENVQKTGNLNKEEEVDLKNEISNDIKLVEKSTDIKETEYQKNDETQNITYEAPKSNFNEDVGLDINAQNLPNSKIVEEIINETGQINNLINNEIHQNEPQAVENEINGKNEIRVEFQANSEDKINLKKTEEAETDQTNDKFKNEIAKCQIETSEKHNELSPYVKADLNLSESSYNKIPLIKDKLENNPNIIEIDENQLISSEIASESIKKDIVSEFVASEIIGKNETNIEKIIDVKEFEYNKNQSEIEVQEKFKQETESTLIQTETNLNTDANLTVSHSNKLTQEKDNLENYSLDIIDTKENINISDPKFKEENTGEFNSTGKNETNDKELLFKNQVRNEKDEFNLETEKNNMSLREEIIDDTDNKNELRLKKPNKDIKWMKILKMIAIIGGTFLSGIFIYKRMASTSKR